MAFTEKLDDKVTKWQSSNHYKLLVFSYFVNFATLPLQNILSITSDVIRHRASDGSTTVHYRSNYGLTTR